MESTTQVPSTETEAPKPSLVFHCYRIDGDEAAQYIQRLCDEWEPKGYRLHSLTQHCERGVLIVFQRPTPFYYWPMGF